MRTDFGFVAGSVVVTLAITAILAGLVLAATGSWSYAGGMGLFVLEAAAPVAAWLVDRMMTG